MKVSIITVSYNSESTIETTFKSLEEQSYSNIEYIVVDGGSTDNTIDLINRYNHIITKWVSESDQGLYDAMNKAIKMATGDVIGLINSDDLFCDKDAVKKVVSVFETQPDLDSVYADLYYVAQNNIDNIIRRWVTGEQRRFNKGWHPAHPTFYVKKKIYDRFGLFNLEFKLAADFEIMLRFLEAHNITTKYLPIPLVKMRLGGETNKSIKNIIRQNSECIRAFKENKVICNKYLYPLYRLVPKVLQFFR